jgi:putative PIN family toxin of toxin-antitoxin system
MKIVLDANVFLSALFSPKGLCSHILRTVLTDRRFTLVVNESICTEIRTCLSRPKTIKQTGKSKDELTLWLESIVATASIADDVAHARGICRDPNDDMYLSVAFSSKAVYLVTGDKDLLVLESFEQTVIVDPRTFWELIQSQ